MPVDRALISIIIQARLTSSRLPGKVLLPFGAHPMLWHTVTRCRAALGSDSGVRVAIPSTPENDPLAQWLTEKNVAFYRGPEDDVLARYLIGAAWLLANDPHGIVVRITADCPLVDPGHVSSMIQYFLNEERPAFAANRYGNEIARGLDVEIMTAKLLAWRATQPDVSRYEREHVTPWLRRPECLTSGTLHPNTNPTAGMRWTLDTPEDYAWFTRLAQHVNTEPPHPTTQEVLDYIAQTGDVLYEPEA